MLVPTVLMALIAVAAIVVTIVVVINNRRAGKSIVRSRNNTFIESRYPQNMEWCTSNHNLFLRAHFLLENDIRYSHEHTRTLYKRRMFFGVFFSETEPE